MSKLTAMLVCTHSLCDWALALDLALESGPRSGKKASPVGGKKPRADAVEALMAAVFLDAKGAGLDPLAIPSLPEKQKRLGKHDGNRNPTGNPDEWVVGDGSIIHAMTSWLRR